MDKRILVVDDEPVQRRLLESALARHGLTAITAESGEQALSMLQDGKGVDAIILDLVMPGMSGMDVLEKLAEAEDAPPVIVQTAQGGIDVVVNAMRLGAFDFVVKPVAPDRLLKTVEGAIRFKGIAKIRNKAATPRRDGFNFKDIVTASSAMQPVIAVAGKAARSNIPVLIEGESGVGKELIARAMHGASPRHAARMVTVNCGALPENLVESLLFGHEKGAFTGATDKHVGKFEEANGGTLFLDEIGELPLDLQVKLLRAIQEGEIDPVGARKPVRVDVRIISATNRDLRQEVAKGRFREDLYYRLSVLPVTLPPLRERRDDIEPLVYHFVKKIGREQGKQNISAIRPEVIRILTEHDWPGNIRELENAIFRAIILCDGDELTLADFPQIHTQLPDFELPDQAGGTADPAMIGIIAPTPSMETPEDESVQLDNGKPEGEDAIQAGETGQAANFLHQAAPYLSPTGNYGMVSLIGQDGECRSISEVEEETIRFAIEIYKGRMSEVARRLGIGRSTLYRKLRDLGMDQENG